VSNAPPQHADAANGRDSVFGSWHRILGKWVAPVVTSARRAIGRMLDQAQSAQRAELTAMRPAVRRTDQGLRQRVTRLEIGALLASGMRSRAAWALALVLSAKPPSKARIPWK
jgi:hypothetical protein